MNDPAPTILFIILAYVSGLVFVASLLFNRRPAPPNTARYADLARIERLERRVDAIMAHLGIPEPAEPPANPIRDLARGGNKIGAIKLYREEHHGMGLKAAKEAVEAIMEGNEPPIGLPEHGMP